ncbi:ankyrin repeat domain-containing protein [Marinobacter sp. R17]|uniref:ankyrin repeat domain-containing protein n=1 Tax=Marinobacter sp. R17 TaxID=2484250 RepID=UPI000F4C40CF|nr:ankyrin repeat domain-containing protein [Marinobacter sp. R17]
MPPIQYSSSIQAQIAMNGGIQKKDYSLVRIKALFFVVLMSVFQFVHAGVLAEKGINEKAYDAIRDGNIDVVRELIRQGMDPNHRLGKPGNVMGVAAYFEHPAILSELIAAGGNIHHKLERGMYFTNFIVSRKNFELLNPDFS